MFFYYFLLTIIFCFSNLNLINAQQPNQKILKTIIVDNYYPYTFLNKSGTPDGFSIDLIKAVTQVMGIGLDIRADTWQYAMEALKTGQIDFLPMMAYSRERDKLFDFSVPHTIAYDAFFTRKNGKKIKTLDDLKGNTIIVMKNDQAHDYIISTGLFSSEKIIFIDSLTDALRLLSSGKGDAALMPKLVGLIHIKNLNLNNLKVSPIVIDAYERPFSFAVKEGNQKNLERLSQGLNIIKTTGQYNAIYNKWFGDLIPQAISIKIFFKYIALGIVIFFTINAILLLWSFSLRKQVALRTKSLETEIKDRKKAEAKEQVLKEQLHQSQKMESIGQLAGGVAHDFNNLLSIILGNTELMENKIPKYNPLYLNIEKILKATDMAKSLIKQLLLFSRRGAIQPKNIELNDVIRELIKMIERIIGEHINLELKLEYKLKTIYADIVQLEQVIMNLCINARDAMAEGGKIIIETQNISIDSEFCHKHTWSKPGNYVCMTISDTGHGIPPEIMDKIFEPFFTTKEMGKGTGLGLAVVYGIVKSHNGIINIHSEIDQGTVFKVYFPISEK